MEEDFWGPERVARLFPARGRLDLGAQVSAGSDFPVGQFGAMRSVWGMTTRQTVIGVKGPEHAITHDEGLALHTTNAARLLGEEHLRGTLTPGRLADLTLWDQDPARCPRDALRDLNPTHTLLGGRLVHRAGPTDRPRPGRSARNGAGRQKPDVDDLRRAVEDVGSFGHRPAPRPSEIERCESVQGVSETPTNTLQYRLDGPEDAPVLILGPSLGTTWHRL